MASVSGTCTCQRLQTPTRCFVAIGDRKAESKGHLFQHHCIQCQVARHLLFQDTRSGYFIAESLGFAAKDDAQCTQRDDSALPAISATTAHV